MSQVLLKVKQEVGLYESQPWNPKAYLQANHLGVECGDGDVRLNIERVRIELTGSFDNTTKASGSANIPVLATAPLSLSPSASGSYEISGGEDLTYTYYVFPPGDDRAKIGAATFANMKGQSFILPALQNLREAVLTGATQLPCMNNTPDGAGNDDSVIFNIALVQDVQAQFGFDIYIVNVSSSVDHQVKSGNTITVYFHPNKT